MARSPRRAVEKLATRLAEINRARAAGDESEAARIAEEAMEREMAASRRLAAYGTLRPGGPNHHLVAHLRGDWVTGWVRGRLHRQGWGLALGYPALRLDPSADAVPVALLASEELPAAWDRLDRFEGPGYLRVLTPVALEDGSLTVANLYEGRAAEA